jgi:hypothetical protein
MPGLINNDMDSSPTTTEDPKRTNTLVLTQLPTPFFHPRVMDALRDHFACHGKIRAWAPLRTFSRVVVVYESEDSADEAKTHSDGLSIDATPETYARTHTLPYSNHPLIHPMIIASQTGIHPACIPRRPDASDATGRRAFTSSGDREKFPDFATGVAACRMGTGRRRAAALDAPSGGPYRRAAKTADRGWYCVRWPRDAARS